MKRIGISGQTSGKLLKALAKERKRIVKKKERNGQLYQYNCEHVTRPEMRRTEEDFCVVE